MRKIMLVAAVLAAFSSPALAAPGDTDSENGAATATVVAPITLTHVSGATLSFGTFTSGTTGGSVSVTSGGVGTASGDVTLMSTSTESADAFTVAGDPSRSFDITTAAGSVTSGANSMAFTTSAPATGTLSGAGAASFAVAGVLTVGGNQAAGTYTGSYAVTVTYN